MRTPRNERLSADSRGKGPERKCILSGGIAARDSLVRLAISPDGEVLPDVLARAPGRGAWIGVTGAELEKALAKGQLKGALARAFKGVALSVPEDLSERIEQALQRSFADRLGLELKAGHVLLGSDRIAEHSRAGRICWLGHAADASEDGRRKLDQAYRVGLGKEGSGLSGDVLPLDRKALSVALGRENVVHLALTDPAAADRVRLAHRRLLNFQGQSEANGKEVCGHAADAEQPAETLN